MCVTELCKTEEGLRSQLLKCLLGTHNVSVIALSIYSTVPFLTVHNLGVHVLSVHVWPLSIILLSAQLPST